MFFLHEKALEEKDAEIELLKKKLLEATRERQSYNEMEVGIFSQEDISTPDNFSMSPLTPAEVLLSESESLTLNFDEDDQFEIVKKVDNRTRKIRCSY